MLKKMALDYFKEEEISSFLINDIDACKKRTNAKLDNAVICSLKTNHSFHDAYLVSVCVCSENGMALCQLSFARSDSLHRFTFRGISSLHVEGDLVSPDANYPKQKNNSSIAQVLDIWFDYQNEFECCILLDSERFILLKAQNVQISA